MTEALPRRRRELWPEWMLSRPLGLRNNRTSTSKLGRTGNASTFQFSCSPNGSFANFNQPAQPPFSGDFTGGGQQYFSPSGDTNQLSQGRPQSLTPARRSSTVTSPGQFHSSPIPVQPPVPFGGYGGMQQSSPTKPPSREFGSNSGSSHLTALLSPRERALHGSAIRMQPMDMESRRDNWSLGDRKTSLAPHIRL